MIFGKNKEIKRLSQLLDVKSKQLERFSNLVNIDDEINELEKERLVLIDKINEYQSMLNKHVTKELMYKSGAYEYRILNYYDNNEPFLVRGDKLTYNQNFIFIQRKNPYKEYVDSPDYLNVAIIDSTKYSVAINK